MIFFRETVKILGRNHESSIIKLACVKSRDFAFIQTIRESLIMAVKLCGKFPIHNVYFNYIYSRIDVDTLLR